MLLFKDKQHFWFSFFTLKPFLKHNKSDKFDKRINGLSKTCLAVIPVVEVVKINKVTIEFLGFCTRRETKGILLLSVRRFSVRPSVSLSLRPFICQWTISRNVAKRLTFL